MGTNFSKTRIELRISNKSDFVSSIVLFFTGIIFYFVIIPREIILEDEAVIGPDLLPNICIILIRIEIIDAGHNVVISDVTWDSNLH